MEASSFCGQGILALLAIPIQSSQSCLSKFNVLAHDTPTSALQIYLFLPGHRKEQNHPSVQILAARDQSDGS